MRRMFAGGAVLGALAIGAVAAPGAAASGPALFECAKAAKETVKYMVKGNERSKSVYTGAYTEKKCATLAGPGVYRAEGKPEGEFELKEGIGKRPRFGTRDGGGALLASEELYVECERSVISGEHTSPTTVGDVVITMAHCAEGRYECSSTPTPPKHAGIITIGPLSGSLGVVNPEKDEVGVDLAASSGGPLVELVCSNSPVGRAPTYQIEGSITSVITGDVSKISKTFDLQLGGEADALTLRYLPEASEEPIELSEMGFKLGGGPLEIKT